jgi:hypothetical protein
MTPVGDAPVIDEVNLDVDHNDAPLHDGAIYDVIGEATPPGLLRQMLNVEWNFTSTEEPTFPGQKRRSPNRR